MTTVEKKSLFLSLPYLGNISLQTKTKLKSSWKGILSYCKLIKKKLAKVFRFKDRLPFDWVSGVVYKYTCGRLNSSYYNETYRHLKVRSAQNIGIWPLIFRKVKPSKESEIGDHLLIYNYVPSFYEFNILAYGQHKYLPEIKGSIFIKRSRLVLSRNTTF